MIRRVRAGTQVVSTSVLAWLVVSSGQYVSFVQRRWRWGPVARQDNYCHNRIGGHARALAEMHGPAR
jgi:hypothetical protein